MSPLPPPSWKYPSTVDAHRHKDFKKTLWFHGSVFHNWSLSLFISDRRSVKLTVSHGEGGQETQGIKRLFEVRGRLSGIYCSAVPHTHTHTKMRQYLNLEETLLRLRAEVFPSLDGAAHLEVFSEEWTQIRNRSHGRVALHPPALMYHCRRKWCGGWNRVSMHSGGKKTETCTLQRERYCNSRAIAPRGPPRHHFPSCDVI